MMENGKAAADVAVPTLLYLMGLEQPEEMTGESMVRFYSQRMASMGRITIVFRCLF